MGAILECGLNRVMLVLVNRVFELRGRFSLFFGLRILALGQESFFLVFSRPAICYSLPLTH